MIHSLCPFSKVPRCVHPFVCAPLVYAAGWGMAGDMAVGAAAQLMAGVVFTPIDIVKERLQVCQ